MDEYYIIIDTQNQRELDNQSMQEYVINYEGIEGELYHRQMPQIKITYNIHNGQVKLIDIEKKDSVNFDYSNAYKEQREQVEAAIRRCAKAKLLYELLEWKDLDISNLIEQGHGIAHENKKIREHTLEVELDMTLYRIIKLGYPFRRSGLILGLILFPTKKSQQTQIQRAVYSAFEDYTKMFSGGSQGLTQINCIRAVEKLKELINEHFQQSNIKIQSSKP